MRGAIFARQTVSAEVNINERLIMAQLRLMASIFSPLFSFDGGSIKAGQRSEQIKYKVRRNTGWENYSTELAKIQCRWNPAVCCSNSKLLVLPACRDLVVTGQKQRLQDFGN